MAETLCNKGRYSEQMFERVLYMILCKLPNTINYSDCTVVDKSFKKVDLSTIFTWI